MKAALSILFPRFLFSKTRYTQIIDQMAQKGNCFLLSVFQRLRRKNPYADSHNIAVSLCQWLRQLKLIIKNNFHSFIPVNENPVYQKHCHFPVNLRDAPVPFKLLPPAFLLCGFLCRPVHFLPDFLPLPPGLRKF